MMLQFVQIFLAQASVCMDYLGTIIGCFTIIGPPCAPVYGEAKSAFLACHLALSLGLSQFILEGDSLIVAFISSEAFSNARLENLFHYLPNFISYFMY
jgi:hypothetical protein